PVKSLIHRDLDGGMCGGIAGCDRWRVVLDSSARASHRGEILETRAKSGQAWRFGVFEVDARAMKLRETLGDSADAPLYIETIPKRGYRFIAPVEATGNDQVASENTVSDAPV